MYGGWRLTVGGLWCLLALRCELFRVRCRLFLKCGYEWDVECWLMVAGCIVVC